VQSTSSMALRPCHHLLWGHWEIVLNYSLGPERC
jgi:hypothetical protein